MIINFQPNNLPSYMNDVPEIVRAFYPFVICEGDGDLVELTVDELEDSIKISISSPLGNLDEVRSICYEKGSLEFKRIAKRETKNLLYSFLNKLTNISLPYGSLTGVRPTRLYYDKIGISSNIKQQLVDDFFVDPSRADLIEKVVDGQKEIYSTNEKEVDIFVNIPICPTRCRYCSFISTEIGRVKKYVQSYVDCVVNELTDIKRKVVDNSYLVRSIYIGGGTPTSLTAEQLYQICKPLSDFNVEFTVEAGRPDSITYEKLLALKKCGVTRISVNPQTFKDETLLSLGRNHTTKQLLDAFVLAREFDFDVNMDLIAGLPGENYEDFVTSLNKAIDLNPENITVHTLSLKRGSTLKQEGNEKKMDGSIRRMTDYAIEKLTINGYIPYYMYRQKNMADGLENVGWCKPEKQCIYNVDYMEETTSVLSAGAGAVSKYVYHDQGRIERESNAKGFEEYLRRKGVL